MGKDYLSFWGVESSVFYGESALQYFFTPSSWKEDYQRYQYFCQQESGLLLIEGAQGSGKTTIGKHLYNSLTTDSYEVLYFNISKSEKKSGWLLKKVSKFFNTKITAANIEKHRQEILLGFEELNHEKKKLIIFLDNIEALEKQQNFNDINSLLDMSTLFNSLLSITMTTRRDKSDFIKKNIIQGSSVDFTLNLTPWSKSDCNEFIKRRLKLAGLPTSTFPKECIDIIHEESKGKASIICNLSEKSLLEAYIQKTTTVDRRLVLLAANRPEPVKKTKRDSERKKEAGQTDKKTISFEQLVEKDVI